MSLSFICWAQYDRPCLLQILKCDFHPGAILLKIFGDLAESNGSLGRDIGEKGRIQNNGLLPPIMRLTIAIFVFLVLG